jgi:hypothetical protein
MRDADGVVDRVAGVMYRSGGLEPMIRRARTRSDWLPVSMFRVVRRRRFWNRGER